MLTHDNVLRCSFTACLARAMEDGRRMLFSLPLYHNYAYVEGMLAAVWAGGAIIMQDRFDAGETLSAIEKWQVNEILLVPTMTIAMIEHPNRDQHDFSSLTAVMSAAAAAPVTLWDDICRIFGVDEVTTAYGQTECSSSATYKRPEDPIAKLVTTVGRLKPRSVAGDPDLDGRVALYRIADPESGEILPDGVDGELIVRGPELMRGYYNKPEETAAVFRADGWMRTGDLGHFTPDGFLALTGRSKELYKCGGELVAPKEVEDLLSQHADVSQAYVVGIPDARMGEVGCAVVIPVPDAEFDGEALLSFCSARLARYKVPKFILPMSTEELPLTATGKVQKFRLAPLVAARLNATGG
jgi:fatty-acyl-CoA synthase